MNSTYEYLLCKLSEIIKKNDLESVCDYGCGDGEFITALSEQFEKKSFYGVDFKSTFAEVKKNNAEVKFFNRDEFNFKDNRDRFDIVISLFSLHHYLFPINELKSITNTIKPGGQLFICDFSFDFSRDEEHLKNISSYIGEMFSAFRGTYHRHHYSSGEVEDIISSLNLKVVEKENKIITPSDYEMEEDRTDSLNALKRKEKRLCQEVKSPVLKQFFSLLFEFEREAIEKDGINYSSIFCFLLKK